MCSDCAYQSARAWDEYANRKALFLIEWARTALFSITPANIKIHVRFIKFIACCMAW